jgi:hypothetical protein
MFQMDSQKMKFASNRTIDLPKLKSFGHSITLNSVHQQHPHGSPHPIDQHKSIDQNGLRARPLPIFVLPAPCVSLKSKANIQEKTKFLKTVAIFSPLKANNSFHHMCSREPPGGNQKQIPAVVQI